MEIIIGAKILSTIEYDLAATAVTQTTHKIYKVVGLLISSGHEQVEKTLTVLDLPAKLKVLDAILEENKDSKFGGSIDLALMNVQDIVDKIHEELKLIEKAIEYHKTKYLNSWRSLGCDKNIERLVIQRKILDERFELFIKTLVLEKNNVVRQY